jgi:hypothetical protein
MNKHYLYFQIFLILIFTYCSKDISGPINGFVYDERNISRNEGLSSAPRVAVDNLGSVHVVWKDEAEGEFQIYYRERVDGNWLNTKSLSDTTNIALGPDIVVDNFNNLHVVYTEFIDVANEIFYRERDDSVWSQAVNISQSAFEYGGNHLPAVCTDYLGNVYVSWMDAFGGISFRKKEGGVWKERVDIPGTMGGSNPMMYVENEGRVHIVYDHGIVFYISSSDGGNTWEEPVEIPNEGIYYDWVADVVATSGKVYVVWTRSKYGEGVKGLYMAVKDTNGVWSEPERIPVAEIEPHYGTIESDGNYLYLTWCESVNGQAEVYLAKKDIDGEWEEPINVSNTPTNSITRGYDIANGVVYIAWFEKITDNNWDIYFDEVNP